MDGVIGLFRVNDAVNVQETLQADKRKLEQRVSELLASNQARFT